MGWVNQCVNSSIRQMMQDLMSIPSIVVGLPELITSVLRIIGSKEV